ncbi:MAG TPA: hypothetical protein VHS96_05060, partial [Bacteroidia bacterium]|nr:hypothetical protein [Bacteroidia bacterium]
MKVNAATGSGKMQWGIAALAWLCLGWGCASESGNGSLSSENHYLPNGQMLLTTESDSAFEALEDLDHGDRENW